MSGQQIAHLIRMANQIARNMGGPGDGNTVAAGIGEHLRKFWTPAMREQLQHYHRNGGRELLPAVQHALDVLADAATKE